MSKCVHIDKVSRQYPLSIMVAFKYFFSITSDLIGFFFYRDKSYFSEVNLAFIIDLFKQILRYNACPNSMGHPNIRFFCGCSIMFEFIP